MIWTISEDQSHVTKTNQPVDFGTGRELAYPGLTCYNDSVESADIVLSIIGQCIKDFI